MSTNTEKVSRVLDEHEVAFTTIETTTEGDEQSTNFSKRGDVFNVLTKKVLPESVAKSMINIEKIGQARYQSFITEKLEGLGFSLFFFQSVLV